MLRGQSLWTALVFNPFQCHTPCIDDLAEGFAGFKSSLATDGKGVPSEWMCSAIPLLNSLQNICKGRQNFFLPLPVLLNLVSHLLWFIIARKSGGIFAQPAGKMHAGFACLSFPQPHGAAWQSCGGGQVGNWEGMERYHLFLQSFHAWHLPALAMAPAGAGWSISTLQMSSEYPRLLLPEDTRNLCLHMPPELLWWKIISVHVINSYLRQHSDHGESKGGPLDLAWWSRCGPSIHRQM